MKSKLKLIVNNKFYKKEKFFIRKELKAILNLYAKKVSAGDWKDYGLSINKRERHRQMGPQRRHRSGT